MTDSRVNGVECGGMNGHSMVRSGTWDGAPSEETIEYEKEPVELPGVVYWELDLKEYGNGRPGGTMK